jgi:hypothetical protein
LSFGTKGANNDLHNTTQNDRHNNGQKTKGANNDLQNTTQKDKHNNGQKKKGANNDLQNTIQPFYLLAIVVSVLYSVV